MYLISPSTFISLLKLPLSSLNPEKSSFFRTIGVSINLWFSKHGICFGLVRLAVPPSSPSPSIFRSIQCPNLICYGDRRTLWSSLPSVYTSRSDSNAC
ncbi:hypothetical protein E2C01_010115 [Portunus trituberculatus]|uniref:Uncharacterized protein n=1 Tax=Portunus trituberculatus TaxID=210409 RepID=A0A5B7D7U8_PORTR|nr:hypothetical protein [Portunus trituberculatus]